MEVMVAKVGNVTPVAKKGISVLKKGGMCTEYRDRAKREDIEGQAGEETLHV